jgi:hypothetical protein
MNKHFFALMALLAWGCTSEQVAEFKEGMRRGAEFRERVLSGLAQDASTLAGAYARGYAESYQSQQSQQNQWHSGLIMPATGGGMPGSYDIDSSGGTILLPAGPPSPNGPSLLDRTITVMGN